MIIITAQVTSEDNAVAFFNSLNCPIISATKDGTSSVITINNTFEIKDITVSNGVKIYKNGVQQSIDVSRGYQTPYVTVIYADEFVYIWARSSNVNWLTAFCIMTVKNGEKQLDGCYGSTGYYGNITNMPLIDANSGLEYRINTVFKEYTPAVDCLDYTSAHLFQSGIKQPDAFDYILDTSTITSNTVITFNSQNYYALGPHCLILIDE